MPWQVYNSAGQLLQATDLPDNAVTNAKIANDPITEAKLDVSNGPTNGQFLQAQSGEGGGLPWAAATSTFIGCKVYHNANQNVSNGSETALSFNSEDWDTDAMHDNSTNNTRITFKTAGKYFIQGHVQVADIVDGSGNTAGRRHLAIRLNGGNRNVVSQSSPSLSDQWAHQASVMLDVSVNDYVELLFLQSSGETLAVQYNNGSPFFTAYKLD